MTLELPTAERWARVALSNVGQPYPYKLDQLLNADGGMWVEQMVPLLGAGYRVLRLDMRGHGGSAPVEGDYTMDQLAADVKGAFDVLDIKKVHYIGLSIGGIMDPQYLDQPWSWAKAKSIAQHLWIPVLVIGTSGTAGMIRRLRANLLDELQKQYVVTARAKGLPPFRLLIKYPLRMSLNPFISDIGHLLPSVVSGSAIEEKGSVNP